MSFVVFHQRGFVLLLSPLPLISPSPLASSAAREETSLPRFAAAFSSCAMAASMFFRVAVGEVPERAPSFCLAATIAFVISSLLMEGANTDVGL